MEGTLRTRNGSRKCDDLDAIRFFKNLRILDIDAALLPDRPKPWTSAPVTAHTSRISGRHDASVGIRDAQPLVNRIILLHSVEVQTDCRNIVSLQSRCVGQGLDEMILDISQCHSTSREGDYCHGDYKNR